MGAVLHDQSIPEIKAKAICGLANNQLASEHNGDTLLKHNITYVPDYAVNSGGMIGASTVIYDTPDREKSEQKIHSLYESISSILQVADAQTRSTSYVADNIAKDRISTAHARKKAHD